MASLLSPILSNSTKPPHSVLLLQSSLSQSCSAILRAVINNTATKIPVLLISLLYPPRTITDPELGKIQVLDRTSKVPGYDDEWDDPRSQILASVKCASPGPIDVIIDSVDTLCSDLSSVSATYTFLSELLSLILSRPSPSRLILHICVPPPFPRAISSPTTLLHLLTQTRFSPTLTHIIAHPPSLISHISRAYLTPPPPLSPPQKFWRVFIPLSERQHEVEKLIFGQDGQGSGSGEEIVVEVLIRGVTIGGGDRLGKRKGVERFLEGWNQSGPVDLHKLESLKPLFAKKVMTEDSGESTHNVSFNLNLTREQQESRSQVPLPYAHEGKPIQNVQSTPPAAAAIFYDPDSADDIDDDDPDEDLDI
ncbi:hypothetical protein JAAARDRAFT_119421 [Jaapia argillacea MUCL 33604]|uniref:Elongator complex protein 5 n=1 Tax=Jaapia argillacea MUCL 33604 TaxID=933084 RepID=A0A067QM32_9AGAM|nr:hypothetical protein JAAARDRAFT_119421 [Jaapia argillacea MUCL 33604]